jgi:polysaccharide export outer membrane protein
MRFLFFIFLISGFIIACSSCSYKQNQVLFEQKATATQDTILKKNSVNIQKYRIKPQDILQIRNLQNSKTIVDLNPPLSSNTIQATSITQSENYTVEDDGTVALTGLGRIPVAGLTRTEALKKIEDLYRANFLKAPLIDLKITNLKVTILGESRGQGNFLLTRDKTTLVEILGDAGGLTSGADEKHIKIIRGDEANQIVLIIDLNDIRSINDPRAIVQSGDIIYVPQNIHAIRADKNQNLSVFLQPAILLISSALLLFSIIHR